MMMKKLDMYSKEVQELEEKEKRKIQGGYYKIIHRNGTSIRIWVEN